MIVRGAVSGAHDRTAAARDRMADEVAGRGVTDARVLAAMRKVPRHRFVEEALRDRAYGDYPLPIGEGQTISQPFIVGRMTELLRLSGLEKVLEVGTGSGYQAAVLGQCAARVCTVERLPRLAARARQMLEELGYANVWGAPPMGRSGGPTRRRSTGSWWRRAAPRYRRRCSSSSPRAG